MLGKHFSGAFRKMKWNLLLVLAFSEIVVTFSNESHRILSRKKRWLIFPEGSSLQVVHFQGIPMHGVPLVFILGITGAIGYELPYYPLDDIAAEIGERIKNGTLGLRHDKDISKVKYVDKPYSKYTKHQYYYTNPLTSKVKSPYNWHSNYPSTYNTTLMTHFANQPALTGLKNLWSTLKERFSEFSKKNSIGNANYGNRIIPLSRNQILAWRRSGHRQRNRFKLLPVLAKRSAENHFNSTTLKEKFGKEPLVSRRKLYSRIESYLEGKGVNGRECVLKTLCQSKMSSELPNTFLSEIMKAIFSLPKDANLLEEVDDRHYYNAHNGENNDCSLIYDKCKYNLWDNHFMKM